MKKIFSLFVLMLVTVVAMAQSTIVFDKYIHDFGEFNEAEPMQKCTFTFTNKGTTPIVINQAVASCGCTIPRYTKTPIKPGETGTINVTYNGRGRAAGHFKKTITIRSNAQPEMVRLYIEGVMTEDAK